MADAIEQWRPVVGFEGIYEVSNRGRVRSLDRTIVAHNGRVSRLRGRILCPKANLDHLRVTLHRPGTKIDRTIHSLVCAAFNGPKPFPDAVIRHLNGNPRDNRPNNLAWGTCAENTADMIRHGNAYWAKQTHCIHGHEFTPENTYVRIRPDGGRQRNCRACKRRYTYKRFGTYSRYRRKEQTPQECRVCGVSFLTAYRQATFCGPECRRVSRRREFGWVPKPLREEAA